MTEPIPPGNASPEVDRLSIDLPAAQQIPSIPPERYDLRVLASIRRIIRAVDTYSKRLATEYGITVPQLVCMLKLDEVGPLSQKELAGQAFMSPSTVVGIVDRLEKQGLLRRERSNRDRRLVAVTLTNKGRELLQRAPSPLQEALAKSLEKLPEERKLTLATSLETIVELMQVEMDKAAPILAASSDLEPPEDLGTGPADDGVS